MHVMDNSMMIISIIHMIIGVVNFLILGIVINIWTVQDEAATDYTESQRYLTRCNLFTR